MYMIDYTLDNRDDFVFARGLVQEAVVAAADFKVGLPRPTGTTILTVIDAVVVIVIVRIGPVGAVPLSRAGNHIACNIHIDEVVIVVKALTKTVQRYGD